MTNKDLIKKWYENIDSQNFDGIKKLLDSKHSFRNPMTPEPIGAEEHLGMMQMITSSLKGQHHINLLVEEGNHVAVSGKFKGKHTGELMGVAATNKNVEFSFVEIFEIVDGKIGREHIEFNPMSIMTQIDSVLEKA